MPFSPPTIRQRSHNPAKANSASPANGTRVQVCPSRFGNQNEGTRTRHPIPGRLRVTCHGECSRLIGQIEIMSRMSTCALWEEQRLSSQNKEPKLRLSLETRVAEDVTVICCKGRIAYGIEAAALSGEIAELAPQTRRVVIDLSGVKMIDAAGLGALISIALTAQASQCSVKLAAPGNFIRQLLELTKLTSVFEVHPTLDAATVASRGQAA